MDRVRWICIGCLIMASALLAACGPKSVVVLVPDPDGSVGQITVSNAAGSVDMDQANQSTTIASQNKAPKAPRLLDAEAIQKEFADVLSRPLPTPIHFLLYFQSDSVALQPASLGQLPEIVTAIEQRMPTRISVVGHSDTQGDQTYNLELSLRRAQAVKQRLLDRGIDPAVVDVSSHGEENPLVKTADNVANAKNRRVEVIVR